MKEDFPRLFFTLLLILTCYDELGDKKNLKQVSLRILDLIKNHRDLIGIEKGETSLCGVKEEIEDFLKNGITSFDKKQKMQKQLGADGGRVDSDKNKEKSEAQINQIIIEISFELVTFINKAKALGEKITDFDRLDIQIMQSILEKLSGDEKKDKALIEKIFLSVKVKVMEVMSINTREYKVLNESEFNLCINTVYEMVKDMDSRNIKDEADLIKAFENITTKLVVFLQKNKWDVSAEAVISLTLAIVKKWNTEQKRNMEMYLL
jgi:hypothetical protein